MKASTKSELQPPKLPKHLAAHVIEQLEDHAEYTLVDLNGCDFSEQTAADIVFEGARLRRANFARSRLARLRFSDARMENCDLSSAEWEKAHFRRVEIVGCRLPGRAGYFAHPPGILTTSRE